MKKCKPQQAHWPFIEGLLLKALETPDFGIVYPIGDLAYLQEAFEDADQTFEDHVELIVLDDETPVGVVSVLDAPWGRYLIGPFFIDTYNSAENIACFLPTNKSYKLDTNSKNIILQQAAQAVGYTHYYTGASLEYTPTGKEQPSPRVTETVNRQDAYDMLKPHFKNLDLEALDDATLAGIPGVGYIVFSQTPEAIEIEYLVVSESHQKQGHGRRLIDYLAHKHPNSKLILDVAITRPDSMKFYEIYGFEVWNIRHTYEYKREK